MFWDISGDILPDLKLETATKEKNNLHRVLQISETHSERLQAVGFL